MHKKAAAVICVLLSIIGVIFLYVYFGMLRAEDQAATENVALENIQTPTSTEGSLNRELLESQPAMTEEQQRTLLEKLQNN